MNPAPGSADFQHSRPLVRPTKESLNALAGLREAFLADPVSTDLSRLRPVVARSWRRSLACGVNALNVEPMLRIAQLDRPFLQAALPVIDRLATMAHDTGACVILCDAQGTIAATRGDPDALRRFGELYPLEGAYVGEDVTGTNGEGTALEEGASVQIWGPEHFSQGFVEAYCTTAPVRDPIRRNVKAVLTLMLTEQTALDSLPAAIAMIVEGAVADIERTLAERAADREQSLLRAYLRESRLRGAGAVLAIDERTTIANNRAKALLAPGDYAVLSAYAHEASERRENLELSVSLTEDRPARLWVKPVMLHGEHVGTILKVREESTRHVTPAATPAPPAFPEVVGHNPAMARARYEASQALKEHVAVWVTGERGTGRGLMALAMVAAAGLEARVVDCDLAVREAEAPLAEQLAEATARDEVALVLRRLDRVPQGDLAPVAGLLAERMRLGLRVFATAFQVVDFMRELELHVPAAEIALPPLRMRRDDIRPLVDHFLAAEPRFAGRSVSAELMSALTLADWPGNVTELRHVLAHLHPTRPVGELGFADLPAHSRGGITGSRLSRLEAAELEQIRIALAEAHGNRVAAAALLEIGRSTLYRRIDYFTKKGFDLGG